jgi:DNA-binding PadR family transcriptional regulator
MNNNELLELMRSRPGRWFVVGDLIKETKMSPGRLYVALAALEAAGEVTSGWADDVKPRRRFYQAYEA